ncbi:Transferring glycosyl group transferase, putative [Arachis hypogaea]|nr:Transferring glycosyl group transferase, putative [Arachis hypogaea]
MAQRSEGLVVSESTVVTSVQTENIGCNIHPRGNLLPIQFLVIAGWPPYSLPPGYIAPSRRNPSNATLRCNFFTPKRTLMQMVGPKRHFLPLILISVTAFIFYTFHQSSLPPPSAPELNPNFTLQNPIRKNPNPNFTFIIKVLAFNRLDSLSRCLRSLSSADYLGDRVHLHIYIDHFANGSSEIDEKLRESHRILEFAQWLEAWWPSNDDEFAFVVEDDLEVSSLYYEFVKGVIMNFYYNASNYSPSIYGVSLQRARFVPGKHGNKLQLDDQTRLFLYQLVGTWGQILFPKPWKEFRLWYDGNKAKGIRPFLEGMVTTGWYKKMGEKIWTPWFIKFIQSHGYFNIYQNFLHERALSVSHRDAGVNYGKSAGPDSQLIEERSLDFNLLEMQPLSSLKWYDFCFKEVLPSKVVTNMEELGTMLHSLPKQDSIVVVNLVGVSDAVARNLLFDMDQFLSSVGVYKSTSKGPNSVAIKSILAKAYVIRKCIQNRYNTWVINGNMLLNSNLLSESSDLNKDFFVANNLDFFYAKSSSSSEKVWSNDFVSKVVALADSLARKDDGIRFVYVVKKLLEESGARIGRVDETTFGMKICSDKVGKSSFEDKKLVHWSTVMELESVQKCLEELNLWSIDSDLSCTAVVCHKS